MNPLTFTILIAYIPIGIVVSGIYRATPVWEPTDIPNWGLVLLWPFLAIWFSWWFTLDNVQWVHKDINWMKGRFPMPRFLELCTAVAKHHGSTL